MFDAAWARWTCAAPMLNVDRGRWTSSLANSTIPRHGAPASYNRNESCGTRVQLMSRYLDVSTGSGGGSTESDHIVDSDFQDTGRDCTSVPLFIHSFIRRNRTDSTILIGSFTLRNEVRVWDGHAQGAHDVVRVTGRTSDLSEGWYSGGPTVIGLDLMNDMV